MKLKELHSLMQDMAPFDPARLKVHLEQYPTGPEIASRMLFTIESMYNDFEGKAVVDLGCGTGMLAVGAALLGSPAVLGLDLDEDALNVALDNAGQFEEPLPIDFVRADVAALAAGDRGWARVQADTVVMNPPFGTRRKGADVEFLYAAAALLRERGGAAYSLHKSSTRAHLQKVALRELGCSEAEVLCELRYDLPATYKFHKERSKDIEVDLWRFVVPAGSKAVHMETAQQQQPAGGIGSGRKAGGGSARRRGGSGKGRQQRRQQEATSSGSGSDGHEEGDGSSGGSEGGS